MTIAHGLAQFNNHRLNLEMLAEEAVEIVQAKSKIIRFGIDDRFPLGDSPTNRHKLESEIGQFLYVLDILIHHKIVSMDGIEAGKRMKQEKLPKWYYHEGYEKEIG